VRTDREGLVGRRTKHKRVGAGNRRIAVETAINLARRCRVRDRCGGRGRVVARQVAQRDRGRGGRRGRSGRRCRRRCRLDGPGVGSRRVGEVDTGAGVEVVIDRVAADRQRRRRRCAKHKRLRAGDRQVAVEAAIDRTARRRVGDRCGGRRRRVGWQIAENNGRLRRRSRRRASAQRGLIGGTGSLGAGRDAGARDAGAFAARLSAAATAGGKDGKRKIRQAEADRSRKLVGSRGNQFGTH